MTKSLPRKSAMVLGSLVRPHTKRRKRERSVLEKDSITSQNHWTKDAEGSIPLYVATDFKRCSGMSGLPHTQEKHPIRSGSYLNLFFFFGHFNIHLILFFRNEIPTISGEHVCPSEPQHPAGKLCCHFIHYHSPALAFHMEGLSRDHTSGLVYQGSSWQHRAATYHCLQFVSSEKREKRYRHNSSHPFPDSSHLFIKFMES